MEQYCPIPLPVIALQRLCAIQGTPACRAHSHFTDFTGNIQGYMWKLVSLFCFENPSRARFVGYAHLCYNLGSGSQ